MLERRHQIIGETKDETISIPETGYVVLSRQNLNTLVIVEDFLREGCTAAGFNTSLVSKTAVTCILITQPKR